MRTVAALLLALVACDKSGVQFIVHIPADYGEGGDSQVKLPDEVRLFVGLGEEHAIRLAPEGFAQVAARSGTFWLRDPDNLPDVDRAPISADAPAVFSFEHTGDLDELGIVVAVGYSGGEPTSSAAIFHAKFGDGLVQRYRMGLNGAADPRTPAMRTRVNQLELWGEGECVHVENRRSDVQDQGHRTAFIVGSKEDRDCDGFPEGDPLECNADVHLGVGPATEPSCLYRGVTSANLCTIGAARCRDGVGGDDQTCGPTRYCASPDMCVVCANAPSWDCAQDYQARKLGTTGGYGLECFFPSARNSTFDVVCENAATVTIIPPPGTTCEAIKVKAIADPAFSDTFTMQSANDTATVKVTTQGCTLKLEPKGRVTRTAAEQDFGALMLVDLDENRGLGVPIYVRMQPELTPCGNESAQCTWVDMGANPNACVLLGP